MKLGPWLLILALLAGGTLLNGRILAARVDHGYIDEGLYDAVQPGELASTVALSGLRAVAVDLLWLRTGKLQENNEWNELLALLNLLGTLQPYNEDVWVFSTWNMAYNISLEQPNIEDSWVWIEKGCRTLDEGMRRNPKSTTLYRYTVNLLGQKIVNVDETMRDHYVAAYREAFGEHPMEKVIRCLDKSIEIEKQNKAKGLADKLRLSVWYKCITINRYLWLIAQDAAALQPAAPERVALLKKAAGLYAELERSIQYRQELDAEFEDLQQIDPGFIAWTKKNYQEIELMAAIDAGTSSAVGSAERAQFYEIAVAIYNKLIERYRQDTQGITSEIQMENEMIRMRGLLNAWRVQIEALKPK